jgi:hypothetical protein
VIVGSLLLILGAVVTLVLGLVHGSNAYLIGSIAASLLAAIVLVVRSRQAAAARARAEALSSLGQDDRVAAAPEAVPAVPVEPEEPVEVEEMPGPRSEVSAPEPAFPAPGGALDVDHDLLTRSQPDAGDLGEEDPPEEPAAQQVSAADAARLARMSDDVLVIDGRPRYHLPGCPHLLGRDSEPLPVREAVELGFTPCGRCEPARALLAEPRPV